MTTVAILPIFDADDKKTYRAIVGDKHSVGKTAGQALDALTLSWVKRSSADCF